MQEMNNVPYAGHPRYRQTIAVVKKAYYWLVMKKEVAMYIGRCLECQRIKAKCKNPNGLLHPFPIPEWKWDVATIYFVTKLTRNKKQPDSIMVVVDKLTKSTHFVLVQSTFKVAKIVEVYLKENARLHGIPKATVSDHDPNFNSNFWKGLFKEFGTKLSLSIVYHLQLDGQTEQVNQIIKYIL